MKSTTTTQKTQVQAYLRAQEASQELLIQLARSKKDVLVIGGYGASLTVKSRYGVKCLEYKFKQEEPRYFEPGEHGLSRIIWIYCMTRPTMSAVYWLQEQKIELVMIDKNGVDLTEKEIRRDNPVLLAKQVDLMRDEFNQLEYARHILGLKARGQAQTVRKYADMLAENTLSLADEMDGMAKWFDISGCRWTQTRQALMAMEANIANRYFECWQGLNVQWTKEDEKQNLVNPKFRRYTGRSDHDKRENKRTHNPINAMINFAEHIVIKRVKRSCLKRGLNTSLSFLHVNALTSEQDDNQKQDMLLWDLIEVLRPHVEAAILKFMRRNALHVEWFIVDSETKEVRINHMLAQVLTLWIEREVLDSMIDEIIEEFVSWLKKTEFSATKAVKATGRKTSQTRKKKAA